MDHIKKIKENIQTIENEINSLIENHNTNLKSLYDIEIEKVMIFQNQKQSLVREALMKPPIKYFKTILIIKNPF